MARHKNVFICANEHIPGVGRQRETVERAVADAGGLVSDGVGGKTDLAISLGGDGTLLKCVHLLKDADVVVYGINCGKVGFLTNRVDDLRGSVADVVRGRYVLSERLMLDVSAESPAGDVLLEDRCLNEISIFRTGIRIMSVRWAVDGEVFADVRTDGVVVSTPTGSTAHNLSCGGPVLFPEMEAVIVGYCAPYDITMRPVVLPADSRVEISVAREGSLAVDGQREIVLPADSRVRAVGAEHRARLAFTGNVIPFFRRLRNNALRDGEEHVPRDY